MSLCLQCRNITLTSLLAAGGHILHEDWSSLQTSALLCDLCSAISARLTVCISTLLSPRSVPRPGSRANHELPLPQPVAATLPYNWHQGFDTEVRLSYTASRRVNRKPRDSSSIQIYCGTSSESGSLLPLDLLDPLRGAGWLQAEKTSFSVSTSIPIFVYAGARNSSQNTAFGRLTSIQVIGYQRTTVYRFETA